jgi:hypothetical protein
LISNVAFPDELSYYALQSWETFGRELIQESIELLLKEECFQNEEEIVLSRCHRWHLLLIGDVSSRVKGQFTDSTLSPLVERFYEKLLSLFFVYTSRECVSLLTDVFVKLMLWTAGNAEKVVQWRKVK